MSQKPSYQVLATKYRPVDFDSLVGQDVLVRTLTNSINNNRIANAFLLTGIRGVGKTTTARIIARALNCVGENGKGEATIKPCGVCSNCKSIMEDRHPDVMEMDAASRTGVDDIREVIDNTHYMPIAARYKIYIIDEVHMLSKNAFNALLKTLEEPPAHVKFIFATTEIRKIPVTILSRCMRFDLKRVGAAELAGHLGKIAANENVQIETEALGIICANGEGSVRDALSLLDQVIAHADGQISAKLVRSVLGLSDKSQIIELFSALAKGDIAASFSIFSGLYKNGGDPVLVFNDLLEFTYLTTRVKAAPGIDPETLPTESELCAARILAEGLDIAYLTRLWQVLLKGLGEIKIAPDSFAAAEMILVRIAYMSDLPTPEKIIKDLSNPRENSVQNAINSNENAEHHHQQVTKSTRQSSLVQTNYVSGTNLAHIVQQEQAHNAQTIIRPQNFIEMVDLFKKHGEILLYNWLFANVRLVKFEQGRLEISVCESLPADFSARIADCLKNWTGERWVIVISKQQGQPTIYEGEHASELKLKEDLKTDPEISKVLQMFPGAVIEKIGG